MKTLFLCTISLFILTVTSTVSFATTTFATASHKEHATAFDSSTLVKLLEEYTFFTRTEPQNTSEELVISQLIDGLSAQSARLEQEMQNQKTITEGSAQKNVDGRLRQYYSSVRTALKELHKRQNRVRILAQNLLKGEHEITHIALQEQRSSELQLFSPTQRLRDSFLLTPLVSSC